MYSISGGELILDGQFRKYIPKIHDIPDTDKPREKLLEHGPEGLNSMELLSVVLVTGTKREDVLSMSRRIMKDYGDKSIMNVRNPALLAHDLDIPLGKATQIVALGELGRRFFRTNQASTPTIRTAHDVYNYVKDIHDHPKECLRGLYLNAHNRLVHDEYISIGTVDANMIHPREVFKPALEYAATAVILVHNHPSGVLEPSKADTEITKQLISAGHLLGIDLIDHVIVTRDSFRSIPVQYDETLCI